MLLAVMRECRRFFEATRESGHFELKNGSIAVKGEYLEGQYVAITGSVLNDGVKRVESFSGGAISFGVNPAEYPAWVRPQGTIGLYGTGDRVTHNGERWTSLIDNNSWEPGTTGTQNLWGHIHDSPEEHSTVNEVFTGVVYGLAVPPGFLTLCDEIQAFIKSPAGQPTAYTSESVRGVHSWSKATDKNGAPVGWQAVFAAQLKPYRRMFTEVKL